jgi:hypothetical protein
MNSEIYEWFGRGQGDFISWRLFVCGKEVLGHLKEYVLEKKTGIKEMCINTLTACDRGYSRISG